MQNATPPPTDLASPPPSPSPPPSWTAAGHTTAYEFMIFGGWYLVLIFCCVLPVYCAFRRSEAASDAEEAVRAGSPAWFRGIATELEGRRRATAAVAPPAGGGEGGGVVLFQGRRADGSPLFLVAEGDGTDSGAGAVASAAPHFRGLPSTLGISISGVAWSFPMAQGQGERQHEGRIPVLSKVVANSTMTVRESDLIPISDATAAVEGGDRSVPEPSGGRQDTDTGAGNVSAGGSEAEGEAGEGGFGMLRLRTPGAPSLTDVEEGRSTGERNGHIVPGSCVICLCPYEVGDDVTWSTDGSRCPHAFHFDCIVTWLSKKEEPLCPCCRQDFVSGDMLVRHFLPRFKEGDNEISGENQE